VEDDAEHQHELTDEPDAEAEETHRDASDPRTTGPGGRVDVLEVV
jgi:hypothetical protein